MWFFLFLSVCDIVEFKGCFEFVCEEVWRIVKKCVFWVYGFCFNICFDFVLVIKL